MSGEEVEAESEEIDLFGFRRRSEGILMISPQSNHVHLVSLSFNFTNTIEYGVLVQQSLPITIPHLRSPIAKNLANVLTASRSQWTFPLE